MGRPQVEGRHVITVLIRGRHIHGSPFNVLVRSGRDYVGTHLSGVGTVGTPMLSFACPSFINLCLSLTCQSKYKKMLKTVKKKKKKKILKREKKKKKKKKS